MYSAEWGGLPLLFYLLTYAFMTLGAFAVLTSMAEGDQARVVLADPLYCPRAQADHQAGEAILAANLDARTREWLADTGNLAELIRRTQVGDRR